MKAFEAHILGEVLSKVQQYWTLGAEVNASSSPSHYSPSWADFTHFAQFLQEIQFIYYMLDMLLFPHFIC